MYKTFDPESTVMKRALPLHFSDSNKVLERLHPQLLNSLSIPVSEEVVPAPHMNAYLIVADYASLNEVASQIQDIHWANKRCQIILLSQYEGFKQLAQILRSGVRHCLCLQDPTETLVVQIEQAMAGKVTMCQSALRALTHGMQSQALEIHEKLIELTHREKQTLQFIGLGLTNKDIAENLNIAEGTVKVHVKNLLRKLGFKTRLAAASWLYAHAGLPFP